MYNSGPEHLKHFCLTYQELQPTPQTHFELAVARTIDISWKIQNVRRAFA